MYPLHHAYTLLNIITVCLYFWWRRRERGGSHCIALRWYLHFQFDMFVLCLRYNWMKVNASAYARAHTHIYFALLQNVLGMQFVISSKMKSRELKLPIRRKSVRTYMTACMCTHFFEILSVCVCVCVRAHFNYLRHKVRVHTKMFGSSSSSSIKINSHSAKNPNYVLVLMYIHVSSFLLSLYHLFPFFICLPCWGLRCSFGAGSSSQSNILPQLVIQSVALKHPTDPFISCSPTCASLLFMFCHFRSMFRSSLLFFIIDIKKMNEWKKEFSAYILYMIARETVSY